MPGRALEIALATDDIRRDFEFWSQLGFGSAPTADTWPHPYGVMTAPHLNLGLHGTDIPSPLLTLTRADLMGLVPELETRGVELETMRLGPEVFNELQFSDPAGLHVRIIEARTFSPGAHPAEVVPGRFEALSLPAADTEAVATWWQRLHVDATDPVDGWALLRADIGGHPVAWHPPRLARDPLLVFRHPSLPDLRARLQTLGIGTQARGLGLPEPHVVIGAPGQRLLVLESSTAA